MAKVTSMMNIGKEMERKLSSIGITVCYAVAAKQHFSYATTQSRAFILYYLCILCKLQTKAQRRISYI